MRFRELEREESKKMFDSFVSGETVFDEAYFTGLDDSYAKIRNDVISILDDMPIVKTYGFDMNFAIKFHEYCLTTIPDFNEAVASNYGFWRYMCIKVLPDLIEKRHGLVKEYFYDKNVRLYLPSLWWFVEMSYQGDYASTKKALSGLSTDYILQFVERPGREGMFVEVSRTIFKYLSLLPAKVSQNSVNGQTLLRRVLIQNTTRNPNYNLVLENKVDVYVKELFKSCGVEVEQYGIN